MAKKDTVKVVAKEGERVLKGTCRTTDLKGPFFPGDRVAITLDKGGRLGGMKIFVPASSITPMISNGGAA